jgi:phenylpropionate dioxygenase-like ring-hydroxylating dioxygenase large terminal subunit
MGSIATLRPTLELDQVVDAVMSGRDQSLARAETLPPDAYISEPFFRLEGERIFAREWLCVGHVGQFPAIGDYRPIDLFGELLVVVRAADRIRVMSRVCPHRWAPLVNAPGHAKFFSCPFHKWAFALDGSLLGAPLMDRVEFDGHDCRLTDYRSEIIDGFIYMTFDADAAPLTPRLQDCSADLEAYHLDELVPGFVIDYDLAINWKFIVETFMECYHHIAAHPDTFEKLHPARATYVKDGSQAWTVGHAPLRPDAPALPDLSLPFADHPARPCRLVLRPTAGAAAQPAADPSAAAARGAPGPGL